MILGCEPGVWREIHIGQTGRAEIESALRTSMEAEDRYAYALGYDRLVMVSLDEAGLANGKYYWRQGGLLDRRKWQMQLETQISPRQIQEYSPAAKYREEAALGYFGQMLFDTSRQFDHIAGVAMFSQQMNQIMAMAIKQYGRAIEGQSVSESKGFVFEGQGYGAKCTMKLRAIDERRGIYRLRVEGNIEETPK